MMLNLSNCITFKKGMRINHALKILKKCNADITENNIYRLFDANKNVDFPYIGSVFEVVSRILGGTQKEVREQIVSKLFGILDGIEAEIEENIVIPKDLTKEGVEK